MTLGWVLLLDPHYGLINKLLMHVFQLSAAPFNLYSYWGIVWCHLAFSTSVRFLLMTPAFKTMDAALEEAARISGSNNLGVLFRITVPILAPALLVSTALGFIRSLESFEIELVLGIPAKIYVISTKVYDFIHWEPPLYGRATALCSIFLVMIFLLIWLQRVLLRGREYTTITGRSYAVRSFSLGRWRWVTFAFCMLFILVRNGPPPGHSGDGNIHGVLRGLPPRQALDRPSLGSQPLQILSSFARLKTRSSWDWARLLGTLLYALISYYIVRTRFAGRGLIDVLSWLPWALPGVLISLALLWAALGSGNIVKLIYGTVFCLF